MDKFLEKRILTRQPWCWGLFVTLGTLLLNLVLFKPAVSQAASVTVIQTATATRQPTVTPTPNATAQAELEETMKLLATSPRKIECSKTTSNRLSCYGILLLDFWFQNPQPTSQEQLAQKSVDALSENHYQIQLGWLLKDWFDRYVIPTFQAAGGLPEGFEEQWNKRLRFTKSDLDNNGKPDYLVTIGYHSIEVHSCPVIGLYWLRQVEGKYQVFQIEADLNCSAGGPGIELKSTGDLNGDGRNDLAYSSIQCGASVCTETLHLQTFKNGNWQDLPFVKGNWTPARIEVGPGVNGTSVITATGLPPLGSSWQPFIVKTIFFRWINGEFLPIDIALSGSGELGAAANLQKAGALVRAQRYTEALHIIQTVIDQHVTLYFDYTPYALFRAGMVQLLAHQPEDALQTWQRVTSEFPDHPVSRDLPYLRPLVSTPDGLWRVCAWLRQNTRDWTPPEPHEDWQIHDLFSVPLVRTGYCTLDLLIQWQQWGQTESIAKQARQFNLSWAPLADNYDLNGDRKVDPIGIMGDKLWVFLTDKNAYHPLDASSPFPLRSANLVDSYDRFYVPDSSIEIVDLDADHRPEILFSNAHGFSLAEWTGNRFKPHEMSYCGESRSCKLQGKLRVIKDREGPDLLEVAFTDGPAQQSPITKRYRFQSDGLILLPVNDPLAIQMNSAIEAMYRNRDPRQALSLLKNFTSDDPWQAGLARYLEALAWDYLGDTAKAQAAYRAVVKDYVGTGWSALAQEKIQ
jgi:tetratricopeptide (TPR) repeat protein